MKYQNEQLYSECRLVSLWNAARFYNLEVPEIGSKEYDKICKAFEIINEFSENAGVKINVGKSDGISLLTREGLPSELKSVKHKIDFLGYSISVDHLSIKEISVKKNKKAN